MSLKKKTPKRLIGYAQQQSGEGKAPACAQIVGIARQTSGCEARTSGEGCAETKIRRPNGSTSGLARSVFLPTRMIVRQFRSNASKPLRASMPSRSSARRCHWPGFLEQEKDVGVRATIKRIEIWKLPIWMHPSQLRDELCKWRDMWLVKHSLTKGNGFGRTKRARTIRIFNLPWISRASEAAFRSIVR
jgi:hypothetical protein